MQWNKLSKIMYVCVVFVYGTRERERETIQKVNKDNVASKMGDDYTNKIKVQITIELNYI